jgi:hypothetical protein
MILWLMCYFLLGANELKDKVEPVLVKGVSLMNDLNNNYSAFITISNTFNQCDV